jgi:hypothetical protein
MPAAKKVHQKKFLKFRILSEDPDFTVAWGKFDNEPPERLAMRWNGRPNEPGFPNQGKFPTWFMLPKELSVPLVKALLGTKSAKNQNILEVLKQLHPTAHKH